MIYLDDRHERELKSYRRETKFVACRRHEDRQRSTTGVVLVLEQVEG